MQLAHALVPTLANHAAADSVSHLIQELKNFNGFTPDQVTETFQPMWTPEAAVPPELRAKLERVRALGGADADPQLYMMAFFEIISNLKHTERTGWVNKHVPQPESIADHMYRMAIMCMFTKNKELDAVKCQQLALCHDMAESLVGDITPKDPTCNKEEKHRREKAAMEYIRDLVSEYSPAVGQQLFELWSDYEHGSSMEARFVKDIDKFELLAQTAEYTRKYKQVDVNEMRSAEDLIKSTEVRSWAKSLNRFDQI